MRPAPHSVASGRSGRFTFLYFDQQLGALALSARCACGSLQRVALVNTSRGEWISLQGPLQLEVLQRPIFVPSDKIGQERDVVRRIVLPMIFWIWLVFLDLARFSDDFLATKRFDHDFFLGETFVQAGFASETPARQNLSQERPGRVIP